MTPLLEYFNELIWKYDPIIEQETVFEYIAQEIKQAYPGNYEPRITEVNQGYRLELIFEDSEEATIFNIKYPIQ